MSAWNAPPPTYDAPSTSYMTTTLTPYLQLPHLLSLTWLAYPILSLMFVAFRLQLSLAASQDAVATAKDNLLTSCKAAERAATAAASMPRYMAIASNEQFADAVNASLQGARAALVLSLTIMEVVINFIIDLYRSTLLCFLELVVRGGLAILISAVQEVNQVIQSATSALRTSIQNDISSANNVIKSAIDGINKVNPFGDITAPQINVPSLDALNNVTLPPSFEQALTNLNASLPTVADIKDKVEDVINTPFELLKKDINDTFSGLSFNSSVLPIPEQNRLAFCNDLDMSIVDDVGRDLIKTAKIGVVILILLALLLIGLNCLLTWYKWRCMKSHLEYTREAWMTDPTMQHSKGVTAPQVSLTDHNLMMLQANSEHPLITRIVNQLSVRLRLSPSQHTHMQWFLNYIFHAPAFAVFLIGFFGLLCIQIQLWAMNPLLAKYQDRASAATSDFSNTIATSINASMYNQSAAYANDVNGRVDAIQTTINQGVFGWVNGTTVTLNTTIVNFYSEVENAVATVFNGTILESPANEFLKCLLGTKVDAIENALTFLHDNLKIDMPRVNQTALILSPESVNEATTPIAEAAIGGGNGDQGGLIVRLINSYADSLKKERIMFGIFLGLWGLVVLMGIAVLLWHSYGRAWVEKRKRRKWETEQRSGIDGIVVPFRLGGNPGDEKGVEISGNLGAGGSSADLRSFTPMPSPKAGGFKPFNFAWSGNGSSNGEQARSTDNLNPPQEKTWDSFFGQKPEGQDAVAPVSKSTKLMAIGRKALGKERFKGDKEPQLVSEPSMMAQQDSYSAFEPQVNNRNTAWYGRVATMFGGKKDNDSDSVDFNSNNAGRGRPSLRIEVDRPSDEFTHSDDPYAYDTRPNQSRWSSSPEATQTTVPWMNRLSGSPKKTSASPPRPPTGLPIRLKQHKPAVPSDVGSTFDDSIDALPLPLHHGFENTISSSRSNDAHTSPPPRMKSPLMYPQLSLAPPPRRSPPKPQGLAPPKDRHRRSSSVPSPTWSTSDSTTSLTPVTRLLTTTHARQSSSALNPFVTPFDDEHRVQIDHPPAHAARKSIPTNPFIAL